MNRIFFNHIDRSEALESFINEKTDHLHHEYEFNWIISKEGQKDFKVKCMSKEVVFSQTGRDPYALVHDLVNRIKAKERKLKVA